MTLMSSDLQSDSDLDSIRNSCDVSLQQAPELYISLLNVDGRACLLIEPWALMRFEPLTPLVGVIDFQRGDL